MRELPFSAEAESAALGAMMLEPYRVIPIAQNRMRISVDSFWIEKHKKIYAAILEVWGAGKGVDTVSVGECLVLAGALDQAGGRDALNDLVNTPVPVAHAEYHLDIVKQKEILRKEIAICREIEDEAFQAERGDQHIKTVPARFVGVLDVSEEEESNIQVMDRKIAQWEEAAKEGGKPAIGLDLPWALLTELLCGLEPGLTILAGRPSAGKTTLEDMISCWVARDRKAVLRVTLDSTRDELLSRAICRIAGVSLPKLKFGFAGKCERQMDAVRSARNVIADWPMFINDADRDWRMISSWIRTMAMKHEPALITLDYVQLVGAAEMGRHEWDANARTCYISGQLKKLSLDLRIPVLVLSQLSRAIEKDDREPKLSDLRDSGAIEQDAAKVIFVYKDAKRCEEMEEERLGATKHLRPIWVDVLKHKDGETGKIPMWMRPPYFRLDELAEGEGFYTLPNEKEGLYPDEK